MHFIRRLQYEARRITENYLKIFAAQDTENTVAGRLRFVCHNTHVFADERVHKRRFTDIRSADNIHETGFEMLIHCHNSNLKRR